MLTRLRLRVHRPRRLPGQRLRQRRARSPCSASAGRLEKASRASATRDGTRHRQRATTTGSRSQATAAPPKGHSQCVRRPCRRCRPKRTTGSASAIDQDHGDAGGYGQPRKAAPISNCHFEYTNEADFQAAASPRRVSQTCSADQPSGNGQRQRHRRNITGLSAGHQLSLPRRRDQQLGHRRRRLDQTFATVAETCAKTRPSARRRKKRPKHPLVPAVQPAEHHRRRAARRSRSSAARASRRRRSTASQSA